MTKLKIKCFEIEVWFILIKLKQSLQLSRLLDQDQKQTIISVRKHIMAVEQYSRENIFISVVIQ